MTIFTKKINTRPFVIILKLLLALLAIYVSSSILFPWIKDIITGRSKMVKFDGTFLPVLDWGFLLGLILILLFGILQCYRIIRKLDKKNDADTQTNTLGTVTKVFGLSGVILLLPVVIIGILIIKWLMMLGG